MHLYRHLSPLTALLVVLWSSSSRLVAAHVVDANSAGSSSPLQPSRTTSHIIIDDDNNACNSGENAPTIIAEKEVEEWRRDLPPELRSKNGAPLHRIEINGCLVYLLGSAHVSKASCDDVRLLMEHVRPDVLFVELCSHRVGLMISPPITTTTTTHEQHRPKQKHSISTKGSMMFAKIQEEYAKKLNVTIGGEFKEAFTCALAQQRQYWEEQQSQSSSTQHTCSGCAIILGDRPMKITIVRAWESLRLVGKMKLICALVYSSIKQPSQKELQEWLESILNDRTGKNDLLTKAMKEMEKTFPSLKRVIIDERDEYMVCKLRQASEMLSSMYSNSDTNTSRKKVIVAIVGAGHCSGMLEKLTQQTTGDDALCHYERPETILLDLVGTKKRRMQNDNEVSSLITDITQFDYSYLLENDIYYR